MIIDTNSNLKSIKYKEEYRKIFITVKVLDMTPKAQTIKEEKQVNQTALKLKEMC